MRIIIIVLLLFFSFSNCAVLALENADSGDELYLPLEILDQLSVQNINRFIKSVNSELEYTQRIPELNGDTLKNIAFHGLNFDWHKISTALLGYFFKDIISNIHLMGKLIFLAVLCSLLQNLQNSFAESSIAPVAYSFCYVFLSVIALNAFYQGVLLVSGTVKNMVGFMEAILPLLLSLLAGVGAVMTAAMVTPLMILAVNVISHVVRDLILPLLFLTAILECVNYLTDKYKLSNLAGVLKQSAMAVLGFSMVIFIGIISIQGVAGSVADGLTLRTAKYAAGTFIPVVGKMFADTVELVMGASLLLKSAVGIFGVSVIVLLCIIPLVKLLSIIMVVKIAGALIQPMGDEKMANCLNSMSNNLFLLFGALLTAALMFFLVITMIVGAGNMTLMLK